MATIGLLALLYLIFPSQRRDTGMWARIGLYTFLGFVCPAAVIPVAVCWFTGSMTWWLVTELRARRARRRVEKRVRRLAPAATAGCPPTKPPTPAAETARQKVSRIFWGYAVLVALCMIFALTTQHAP